MRARRRLEYVVAEVAYRRSPHVALVGVDEEVRLREDLIVAPVHIVIRFVPLPPLTRSPFPAITGKASGSNGIIASPVADLSKKQAPMGAADSETGRMGKRPKNTSASDV